MIWHSKEELASMTWSGPGVPGVPGVPVINVLSLVCPEFDLFPPCYQNIMACKQIKHLD